MNKKFLSNINLTISFIVIVLFFGLLSCNSSKKEEKECAYTTSEIVKISYLKLYMTKGV